MVANKYSGSFWSPDALISEIRSLRAHIASEQDTVVLDRLELNLAEAREELARRNVADFLIRAKVVIS